MSIKNTVSTFLVYALSFLGSLSSALPDIAVTYGFSGGRFGDNLLALSHAAWLSYALDIPLIYEPFPFSDRLLVHTDSKVFNKHVCKEFHEQKLWSISDYEKLLHMLESGMRSQKTVLRVPYYPDGEAMYEFERHPDWFPLYMQIDWDDCEFKKLLRSYIALVQPLPKISMPEGRVSVAIHMRKGGGVDHQGWELDNPLKSPPDTYYIEALQCLCRIVNKPMYVFLFTDHLKPLELQEYMSKAFEGKDIIFDSRKDHVPDLLEDFFAMEGFDYLIRSGSNFSLLPSKLFSYKGVISPLRETRSNDGLLAIEQMLLEFGPSLKTKKTLRIIYRKH